MSRVRLKNESRCSDPRRNGLPYHCAPLVRWVYNNTQTNKQTNMLGSCNWRVACGITFCNEKGCGKQPQHHQHDNFSQHFYTTASHNSELKEILTALSPHAATFVPEIVPAPGLFRSTPPAHAFRVMPDCLTPQHLEPYTGSVVYQPGADRHQPRGSGT